MQLQQIQAETQLTKLHKLHKNKINIKNKIKIQKAVQKVLTIWDHIPELPYHTPT